MYDIKSKLFTALLVGVYLLIISGCEGFAGPDEEESVLPQFSYEIYDENGELLKEVTHEYVGEAEAERSLGLFGRQFMPSQFMEVWEFNSDTMNQHEIWLHSEEGVNSAIHTLRFGFPFIKQWESDTYSGLEFTEEELLEQFRFKWERRPDQRFKEYTEFNTSTSVPGEQMVSMDYYESVFVTRQSYGLRIDSTGYLYQSAGGHVELQNVSDSRVEGIFTVDLIGLPMETVFFAEEFPEDPELRKYHITGSFVAVPGDYFDLIP